MLNRALGAVIYFQNTSLSYKIYVHMNSKKMIKSLPGCFQEYGGVSDKKKKKKKKAYCSQMGTKPNIL